MECMDSREQLFRYLDDELTATDRDQLTSHISKCPSCARELKMLSLHRQIAHAIPSPTPSPYFYQKLRARLESEVKTVNIWQIINGLSRHLVPAMAAVTLALLMVFGYVQLRTQQSEIYQAYDSLLISGDRLQRTVIADQSEITDESIIRALAEAGTSHPGDSDTESTRSK